MTSITEINRRARGFALGGAKTPHSVSWPVLRRHGDDLVIAYYTTIYNKDNLDTGIFSRPVEWMEFDIEEGRYAIRHDCRVKDFSQEPFDKTYDLTQNSGVNVDLDTLKTLFKMFDSVRKAYIEMNLLDILMYRTYLETVCKIIPESYRGFIRELSI